MKRRKISLIGIILAFALYSAAVVLLTACRAQVLPLPDESTGFFDVDLMLIGSENGTPYIKEVGFSDSIKTVTVDVSYMLTTVDLELNEEVSGAVLKVNGYPLDYGSTVTVALETGTNSIPIEVTPNLIDPFYYNLIIKQGTAPGVSLSDDATLSSLIISNIPNSLLHPEFSTSELEYTSIVNYLVNDISITVISSNENADITINGTPIESKEASDPFSLSYGTNPQLDIVVTAEDEKTVSTYTLIVTRSSTIDNEAPEIELDSPYSLDVYTDWTEPGYSAYDGHEGDLSSAVEIIGSVDTSKISLDGGGGNLIYSVSDSSNNKTHVTREVIVQDTTDPVITLNGDDPMRINQYETFTDPGATVTDNYDTGDTGLTTSVSGSVNTSIADTYQIIYSAVDSSGNTASETRNVVVSDVIDTTPPTLELIGFDTVEHEVNTDWEDPGASASDNVDGDLSASVSITGTIDTATLGTTTLYYDVSDSSGNAAEQLSRAVNVSDTTPPVITLIGSDEITVAHGSTFPFTDTSPGATVTDNYDTDLTPTVIGSVNMNLIGTYPLLYRAYDSEGNGPAEKTQIFHVTDQTPPYITISGSSSVTIALGGSYSPPTVTAFDNVDGNLTDSIEITGDTINTDIPDDYFIYYNVTDSAGLTADQQTITVTVEDQTPPVITLVGELEMSVNFGEAFTDPGANVTDNWDNNGEPWHITSLVIVDNEFAGDYTLTYDAEDAAGNAAVQVTRTVTVDLPLDIIAPVITLNGDAEILVEYPDTYIDEGAEATDMRDGDPTVYDLTENIVITDNVDYEVLGTYTIDYYVEDLSGNSASVERTVIFEDTTGPVITIDGDNPLIIDFDSVFTPPEASAEDAYDGVLNPVNFTITGVDDVDTSVLSSESTVSYGISDSNGNPSTANLIVHVEDISAPVISIVGDNPFIIECGIEYVDEGATAHDNYDDDTDINDLITPSGLPINTSIPGDYTITYNVSDNAGNSAETASRAVNVIDTTPPIIELLDGEVTVEVDSDWEFQDPGYIVTDNDTRTMGLSVVLSGLDINLAEIQTLTYSLTDLSGNAATPVTRIVNVVDTQAPFIDLEGISSIDVDYGSAFTDSPVTASDNYDGDLTDNIIVSGDTVNTGNLGDYTIYYDVSDSSFNAAIQQSRIVTVADLSAPVITIIGDNPVTIECLSDYTDEGATAIDNLDGGLTGSITTTGLPIETSTPGIYSVTYQVADAAGNTASAERTVNVVDITAPIIVFEEPTTLTVEVNTLWEYSEPGVSATDDVDGDITSSVITSGLDMSVLGDQIIDYNVVDSSDNAAATVSRIVHVVEPAP